MHSRLVYNLRDVKLYSFILNWRQILG